MTLAHGDVKSPHARLDLWLLSSSAVALLAAK